MPSSTERPPSTMASILPRTANILPLFLPVLLFLLQRISPSSAKIPHDLEILHRHNIFVGWPDPLEADELYFINRDVKYFCKIAWTGNKTKDLLNCRKSNTCPNITRWEGQASLPPICKPYDPNNGSGLNTTFTFCPDFGDRERIEKFTEALRLFATTQEIPKPVYKHVFFLLIPILPLLIFLYMWQKLKFYNFEIYKDPTVRDNSSGYRYFIDSHKGWHLYDKRTGRVVGGYSWSEYLYELRVVKYGINACQLNPNRILQPWVHKACEIEKQELEVSRPKKKQKEHLHLRRSQVLLYQ